MRPSVTPSDPLSENRTGVQLEAVSRSESFCCLEIGRYDLAENNPSIRRSVVTLKPAERVIGMAVELLGGAERFRRPIVIQCHTPAPSGRQNRVFLRLFSMNWPVPI